MGMVESPTIELFRAKLEPITEKLEESKNT